MIHIFNSLEVSTSLPYLWKSWDWECSKRKNSKNYKNASRNVTGKGKKIFRKSVSDVDDCATKIAILKEKSFSTRWYKQLLRTCRLVSFSFVTCNSVFVSLLKGTTGLINYKWALTEIIISSSSLTSGNTFKAV